MNGILTAGLGFLGGFAVRSMTEKKLPSVEPPLPPIELKTYVKERTENVRGITVTIPAHWEYPKSLYVNPGVWYILFENIPREMGLIASDDYTSPIMLIHDGKQAWDRDRSDSWLVALMQQDGGSRVDVYYKNGKGSDTLLWSDVRNPYYYDVVKINNVDYVARDKLFPRARLISKTTLEIVPW